MPAKSAALKLSTHITIDTRSRCKSVGYAGDITPAFTTMGKTCFQLNRLFEIPRDLAALTGSEPPPATGIRRRIELPSEINWIIFAKAAQLSVCRYPVSPKARALLNWSQSDLVEKTGLSLTTIRRMEETQSALTAVPPGTLRW
ncbi:hypothetical protein DEV91_1546 [Phyllobacterium brassicacearum]|nr:hypothetical protein DEV91_1546 [Phyllobacterium brassicacearum]